MTVNEILWSQYGWVATGDIEQPDPVVIEEALLTEFDVAYGVHELDTGFAECFWWWDGDGAAWVRCW